MMENKAVNMNQLEALAIDGPIVHEQPDELTQLELEEAIRILRAVKRDQCGYLLASPKVGGGRGLHIVHLDKKRKAA